ncbi:hypothetical protein O3G_MSEX008976 [Manduca sexta]|uniref:Uncharacterized protein n=1 Tax=Manduca sexta TaxID=7130 RepID=A0A921ZCR2_MANSE|nr:hypothetical protein O3G_MSEX008976 [Manduca sexta]
MASATLIAVPTFCLVCDDIGDKVECSNVVRRRLVSHGAGSITVGYHMYLVDYHVRVMVLCRRVPNNRHFWYHITIVEQLTDATTRGRRRFRRNTVTNVTRLYYAPFFKGNAPRLSRAVPRDVGAACPLLDYPGPLPKSYMMLWKIHEDAGMEKWF